MSSPRKRIVPSVASIRRMIARDIVVLPQPDSPTSPSVSPSAIDSVTSLTACTRATSRSIRRPCLIGKKTLRCSTSTSGRRRSSSHVHAARRLGSDFAAEPDLAGPHLAQLALLLRGEPAAVAVLGLARRRAPRAAAPRCTSRTRAGSAAGSGSPPAGPRATAAAPRSPAAARAAAVDARDRPEQAPRVGVLRVVEDLVERPLLDDPARRTSPRCGRRCRPPRRGRGSRG